MVHSVMPAPLVMQRRRAPLLSVWPGWMSTGVDEPCLPWVLPHLLPPPTSPCGVPPAHSQEQASVLTLLKFCASTFSAATFKQRTQCQSGTRWIYFNWYMHVNIHRSSLSCLGGHFPIVPIGEGGEINFSLAPFVRTLQHFLSYQTGFRLQQ